MPEATNPQWHCNEPGALAASFGANRDETPPAIAIFEKMHSSAAAAAAAAGAGGP